MLPRLWEHGSEFHFTATGEHCSFESPWDKGGILGGTGRDVFRLLLLHGQTSRGWRRLWIPSYYCQDVVSTFISTGIHVQVYNDGPQVAVTDLSGITFDPGDVLLRVNYFGLRIRSGVRGLPSGAIEIIEDHTHDPWSDWAAESDADWCVASLRKTLPLPDGGALWSPRRHPLPDAMPATAARREASLRKLAAMALKALYLEGHLAEKSVFRNLATSGEAALATGQVSGMTEWTRTLLSAQPIADWRERRKANYTVFEEEMANVPGVKILSGEASCLCPFSGVLLFDTPERRENVRKQLIAANVYPAILWPLENAVLGATNDQDRDFSRRMLSIHCDMRYTAEDMRRVAALVSEYSVV